MIRLPSQRACLNVASAITLVVLAALLPGSAAPSCGAAEDPAATSPLAALSEAFRAVAASASPGVVHISVRGSDRLSNLPEGALEELAERLSLSPEQVRRLLERQEVGSGSGIILDKEGYILTNSHVVTGRSDITVRLHDDRVYTARLVGSDPATDLAVIKIDAPNLQPLKFGDSDKVQVGDWVLAIGAPFGLRHSVTHGIVSATGRTRVEGISLRYQNFIQTDAAINPGNSGGPLLNLRGEVIGVATAIATRCEGNEGVALTIPSNMALKIARQLKTEGKVTRGWLGISFPRQPLTDDDVEIFRLPDGRGVLVELVVADSPAEKAGIEVEDVIVAVNGEPLRDSDYFASIIADTAPGEQIRLSVIRDGRQIDLKAKLALQPDNPDAAVSRVGGRRYREMPQLGLMARTLCSTTLESSYDETERGVLISSVAENSPAEGLLRPGELIVGAAGQKVASVADLSAAVKAAKNHSKLRLQVLDSAGNRRVVEVPLRP